MDGRVASSGETQRRDGAEVLRVENLTVRYGALVALREVSWSVRPGEILGIIGPNGAGKSSCFAAVTNAGGPSRPPFFDGQKVLGTKTFDLPRPRLPRTVQPKFFFWRLTAVRKGA